MGRRRPEGGPVTIRAHVVRAHGQGVVVQEHAKTHAGTCTIAIPRELVELLRRRQEQYLWPSGFVFPTVRGNVRDPRNTSRDWMGGPRADRLPCGDDA